MFDCPIVTGHVVIGQKKLLSVGQKKTCVKVCQSISVEQVH